MTPDLRQAIVDGAYWLREPGPNCQVVVAYTGAVAPEAIQAVGLMAEDRRDVGLLAVTSADRLNAGWTAALPRPRARPGPRPLAYRAAVRRPAAALRHGQRARRPSRRRWPGSARSAAIGCGRSASSISARPAPSPTSIATTASTPTPSSPPRKRSRRAGRLGISAPLRRHRSDRQSAQQGTNNSEERFRACRLISAATRLVTICVQCESAGGRRIGRSLHFQRPAL